MKKKIGYWLNTLRWYYEQKQDLMVLLIYKDEVIKKLTAEHVQKATQQYFNMENYARFVLLPEEGTTKK